MADRLELILAQIIYTFDAGSTRYLSSRLVSYFLASLEYENNFICLELVVGFSSVTDHTSINKALCRLAVIP